MCLVRRAATGELVWPDRLTVREVDHDLNVRILAHTTEALSYGQRPTQEYWPSPGQSDSHLRLWAR